jgi:hypothetical protein
MAVLLMLLGLAVYRVVVGWSSAGEPASDISAAGYVAKGFGRPTKLRTKSYCWWPTG